MAFETKQSLRFYYVDDPNQNPARATNPLLAFRVPKPVAEIAIQHEDYCDHIERVPYKTYGVIVEQNGKSVAVHVTLGENPNVKSFTDRLRNAAAKATAECINGFLDAVEGGWEPYEIRKMDMSYVVAINDTTRYRFGSALMAARVARKVAKINRDVSVSIFSAFHGSASGTVVHENSDVVATRIKLIEAVKDQKMIIAQR